MTLISAFYYTIVKIFNFIFRQEDRNFGAKRSPKWREVRKQFLEDNPYCAVCGGKKKNEIHHKELFNLRPDLELELTNLINLCERKKYGVNCHLFVGHLGNYRSANPNVVEDAEIWREKLQNK